MIKFLVLVLAVWVYANLNQPTIILDASKPTPRAHQLVVPDTGYNSPTDLLQTTTGTFTFQNASGGIQQ